jgi:CheY-like chemotaxis protein
MISSNARRHEQTQTVMDYSDRLDFGALSALVVDDNIHMRRLMGDILHAFGIGTVLEASDGSDAYETMKTNYIDLVLCDWVMQNLNGIDLLREVRKANSEVMNPEMGFVMMTAHSDDWRLVQAQEAGATSILVKPFSTAALYERIMHAIEPKPLRTPGERPGR